MKIKFIGVTLILSLLCLFPGTSSFAEINISPPLKLSSVPTKDTGTSISDKGLQSSSMLDEALTVPVKFKDMARFYPANTLLYSYMEYTPENIAEIRELIPIQTTINKPVKTIKDLSTLTDGIQFLYNLTQFFGPEISLGILPGKKSLKDSTYLLVFKLKLDNYSPESVKEILSSGTNFNIQHSGNLDIYISTKEKNPVAFTIYNSYLMISNDPAKFIEAVNSYKNPDSGLANNETLRKLYSYIPDDSLIVMLTNNQELMKSAPDLNKKDARPENPPEKQDEKKNETQPEQKESAAVSTAMLLSSAQSIILTASEDSPPSPCPKDNKKDLMFEYYSKLALTQTHTVTSISLKDRLATLKSHTPYTVDPLLQYNPTLKDTIIKFVKENTFTDNFSDILPQSTIALLSVSNIARMGELVNSFTDVRVKGDVEGGKAFVNTFTGLNLDKDILPIFSAQNTIAAVKFENKIEPVFLLSYKPETLFTIDSILNNIMKNEKKFTAKEIKINDNPFKTLGEPNSPPQIAFGRINDAIVFASYNYLQTILNNLDAENSTLSDLPDYKNFKNSLNNSSTAAIYINTDNLLNSMTDTQKKDLPPELQKALESVSISFEAKEDFVTILNVQVKFK